MDAANRDTALECLERARTLLQQGKPTEAKRYADRAQRMCPTSEGEEVLQACENANISQGGTDDALPEPATSSPGWIHPAYRKRVFAITAIVVLLALYRFVGGDPILAGLNWGIGRLPGDIAYSYTGEGSSVHVYFPITTCIIISLVANLLNH